MSCDICYRFIVRPQAPTPSTTPARRKGNHGRLNIQQMIKEAKAEREKREAAEKLEEEMLAQQQAIKELSKYFLHGSKICSMCCFEKNANTYLVTAGSEDGLIKLWLYGKRKSKHCVTLVDEVQAGKGVNDLCLRVRGGGGVGAAGDTDSGVSLFVADTDPGVSELRIVV